MIRRRKTGMTPRQRISEDEFQSAVVEYFQTQGWFTFYIPDWMYRLAMQSMARQKRNDRRWSPPGFPDLVLLQGFRDTRTPVRLIFAELKSDKGTVRENQMGWLVRLSEIAGIEVYVWRPGDDWHTGVIERIAENGPDPDHEGTLKELARARQQLAKVETKRATGRTAG